MAYLENRTEVLSVQVSFEVYGSDDDAFTAMHVLRARIATSGVAWHCVEFSKAHGTLWALLLLIQCQRHMRVVISLQYFAT